VVTRGRLACRHLRTKIAAYYVREDEDLGGQPAYFGVSLRSPCRPDSVPCWTHKFSLTTLSPIWRKYLVQMIFHSDNQAWTRVFPCAAGTAGRRDP
jgi:hypothetical protein